MSARPVELACGKVDAHQHRGAILSRSEAKFASGRSFDNGHAAAVMRLDLWQRGKAPDDGE
jgi:hypothetical protein